MAIASELRVVHFAEDRFLEGVPGSGSPEPTSPLTLLNLQQAVAFAARQHATRTAATARLAQPSPVPFYSPRKSCDHARDSACCPPHDGTSSASVAVQRGRCCMRARHFAAACWEAQSRPLRANIVSVILALSSNSTLWKHLRHISWAVRCRWRNTACCLSSRRRLYNQEGHRTAG